ncbi:MAG: reverse transcriptase domain-containing protein [Anaerolineae bacterium]
MELLERVADEGHLLRVIGHLQRRHRHNGFKPGVDGETLERFSQDLEGNLQEIRGLLLSDSYQFSPFMEVDIFTWGGKVKTISRATLRDTIVQKALALIVEPELDSYLAPNCYSFRVGRRAPNINQAIERIVECHRQGMYWVVKEDISSYFENIEQERLLVQLGDLLPSSPIYKLYRRYLEAPRAVNGRLLPRTGGVLVGTILANFLSNLYLRPLDLKMKGHLYLRYCDDIIVFCRSEEEAQEVRRIIATTTANLGLSLNQEKSLLLPPGAPFVHLGYQFDKEAIKIGPRALAKFKARIRRATSRKRITRRADLATEEGRAILREIIARVNGEITGQPLRNWVRYFAKCDFDDQFRELDFWIRDRVRAAATKRWNKGNYRLLPTCTLQELGLKSLVGEYYRWKNAWKERNKSLVSAIAKLDHLRAVLENYRRRYYHPLKGCYNFRPGADGETMESFLSQETTNLRRIQGLLLAGEYEFSPFIEYAKPKQGREDERVICRSSLADALVQKAVAEVVERRFDGVLSERCYSYRPGRSQYTAFGQALRYIREREEYWVVKGDFRTFLDTVDLGITSQAVEDLFSSEPLLLDLYLKYLYNPRLREGRLLPRTVGLPRGGILTPFLANLYLKPLDEALERFKYLRYADDVFIFAESRAQAEEAQETLRERVQRLRLTLKERIFEPDEEFECLGYRVKGKEIAVRPYALNRLKRRIRRITKRSNYPGPSRLPPWTATFQGRQGVPGRGTRTGR